MSPALINTIIFGVLGFLVFLLIKWEANRTYYRPIMSEERNASNEIEARDEAKNYRIKHIYRWAILYMVLCLLGYAVAFSIPTVKKVQAALYPSATPTQTSTRTPTATPRATNTPLNTATLEPSNFLTQFAGGITPTRYSPPGSVGYTPISYSGGSSSSQFVQVTRIVNQYIPITRIVNQYIPVTRVVVQTVIVIVTPTYTPVETETASFTPSPTATFTETPSPTATETETLTP